MAEAGKLTLTVVTPERAVLQNVSCEEVTLPEEDGEIGILPGHTPLIALLGIGVVGYRIGAKKNVVAVRSGFVEIAMDVVRVLADEAVAPEAVDQAAAARDKQAAEAKRLTVGSGEELDAVNAEVAFAEARIKLAAA